MFNTFRLEDRKQIVRNLIRRQRNTVIDYVQRIRSEFERQNWDQNEHLVKDIDKNLSDLMDELYDVDELILKTLSARSIGEAFQWLDKSTLGQ